MSEGSDVREETSPAVGLRSHRVSRPSFVISGPLRDPAPRSARSPLAPLSLPAPYPTLTHPLPSAPRREPAGGSPATRVTATRTLRFPLRGVWNERRVRDDERTRLRDKNPKGNKESWKSREMS